MTPTRWRDARSQSPEVERASRLLELSAPAGWTAAEEQAFWQRFSEKSRGPHHQRRPFVWALVPLAASLAVVVVAVRARPQPELEPVATSDPGEVAVLESGRVEVRAEGPVRRVKTPELEVVSFSGRVAVETSEAGTEVHVFEGVANVRRTDWRRTLQAAEKVFVGKGGFCQVSLGPAPRRSCLEGIAQGDGLAAQNALYLLALLDQEAQNVAFALFRLDHYLTRFPSGPHATEAQYARIGLYADQGDWAQLERAAEVFLQSHPRDVRSHQIRELLAKHRMEGLRR